jgi:CelD/BcsL family acetyltransferase involved in cellulose biosynthesis
MAQAKLKIGASQAGRFRADSMKVEIIEEMISFESLRGEWNDLLRTVQEPSLFLTHEWLGVYWRRFGGKRKLMILTVRDAAHHLIGAAPLCVNERSFVSIPVFKKAELIGAPFSDILGILIKPGEEERVVQAFLGALRSKGIDLLDLQEIPEGSPVRTAMAALQGKSGFQMTEEEMGVLPYLSTTVGWEDYLASLGKSTQRNFKYYTNRLAKKFQLEFAAHSGADSIEKELGGFFDLYEKRFKAYPTLVDPSHRQFREEIAALFAKNGWMVLFTMKLDGALAAAEWCFSWEGKLLSYNACYDPDWSKEGIANVFQGGIIRYAIENGFREYDFLRGEEGYKGHWTASKRTHCRLKFKRPSLKLSLLERARQIRRGPRNLIARFKPAIEKREKG